MNDRLSFKRYARILLAGMLVIAACTGCVNQYMKSYVPTRAAGRSGGVGALPPSTGKPRLVTTENPTDDARDLWENGYILLGRSKFRSSPIDEKQALAQARKVGAEVVMVQHEFVNSVSRSVPVTQYIPGQVTRTTDQTVIQSGDKEPKVIDRTSMSITDGEFHTTYVDESVDYYDYSATYWAKARPFAFGAYVKELDQQTKVELGTNKGVLVRLVVKNTPAYDADVLEGDVLRRLGSDVITDPARFYALVKQHVGQKVPLVIYRAGQELTKEVAIGSK